jgi:hypothetical protein
MQAFYEVVNIAPNAPRQWARDRTLYSPWIRFETIIGLEKTKQSRGVNSIELYFDGARWWISSVMWQSEDAEHPIPATLLPSPGG